MGSQFRSIIHTPLQAGATPPIQPIPSTTTDATPKSTGLSTLTMVLIIGGIIAVSILITWAFLR